MGVEKKLDNIWNERPWRYKNHHYVETSGVNKCRVEEEKKKCDVLCGELHRDIPNTA